MNTKFASAFGVLVIAASLAAIPSPLHATATELPLPTVDFMTPAQLVKWKADLAAKSQEQVKWAAIGSPSSSTSTHQAATSQAGFYTGKPYLAESGSYSFMYRDYNPEMNRWTTVDPSGFPDGANNRLYAAVPTSQFDNNGLSRQQVEFNYLEAHTPQCIFWSQNGSGTGKGNGWDWIQLYEGNASKFFQYLGGTNPNPNVNQLAISFVRDDLGLQISTPNATSWTAYGGNITWNIYRDVQNTQTTWEFDYTASNMQAWSFVNNVMGAQKSFAPSQAAGKLFATVTTAE